MKIRFHFIIILITISVLSLAQQNEAFRVSYSGLELNFGLWLELETGDKKFVSVWRLQGRSEVIIQGMAADNPVILYLDLGIKNRD